jgi:hypothetical protein
MERMRAGHSLYIEPSSSAFVESTLLTFLTLLTFVNFVPFVVKLLILS